ncbi:MAG TPA: prephenate dehydrogenase [Candidatus Anoxymicrobiaceae bacterium]
MSAVSKRFEKVAVIGTGLMGGSLAMALKASPAVGTVACYDSLSEVRDVARKLGIADEVCDRPQEAVAGAGLVFLATPTGSIAEAFSTITGSLEVGTVVSDLGSAKQEITADIESRLPAGVNYIGGHPMSGSEQSGVESARPDLYRGAYFILTPTENTDAESFRMLHGVLTDLGARVISIDPETHDRAMATVSHVPHLLSLLLMDMASRQRDEIQGLFTVAAGGFRDMTRIAASNPDVWTDICSANRDFIVERLVDYRNRVDELVVLMESADTDALRELFENARRARGELSLKSGQELEQMYDVTLSVPDEPGVISKISTAVGAMGVNIEDIGIVHPLEGETGIMTLKILGKRQARGVSDMLSELGYRATFWRA